MSRQNVELVRTIYRLCEGRAVRFRWFNNPREALEAVGLRE